jgi:hypothetical protein
VSLTLNNTHLSYYSRTNVSEGAQEMGCYSDTNINRLGLLIRYNANIFRSMAYNVTIGEGLATVANIDSTGFYVGSRTASNYHALFKNGSNVASNTTSGGTLPTTQLYLFNHNASGVLGVANSKQCAFASIGDGLSDTDALNFYNIVQAYQTILGRQV